MRIIRSNWARIVWKSCTLLFLTTYAFAITEPADGVSAENVLGSPTIPAADANFAVPISGEAFYNRTNSPDPSIARRNETIRVRARAALVVDMQKGEVIYQRNATSPVPIASITKLMTVLAYMGMEPDLEKRVSITRKDVYRANWTKLKYRERVSVKDLLYATLVSSDNAAARALARSTGLTMEEFVAQMNKTAISLGLVNSNFTEPTGLDARNTSTAVDCVTILWTVLQNELLAEILIAKEYKFGTNRRMHTVRTTNRLLRDTASKRQWQCVGSKTGYIRRAGYCLVVRALGRSGDDIYAVILGGPTSRTRFTDMRRLLDWSVKNSGNKTYLDG